MFLYTVNVNQFLLFESKFDTKLLTMTQPIKDQEKMYLYLLFHFLQSSNCIAAGYAWCLKLSATVGKNVSDGPQAVELQIYKQWIKNINT